MLVKKTKKSKGTPMYMILPIATLQKRGKGMQYVGSHGEHFSVLKCLNYFCNWLYLYPLTF